MAYAKMSIFNIFRYLIGCRLLLVNNLEYAIKLNPNIQEYNTVDQRMLCGWFNIGIVIILTKKAIIHKSTLWYLLKAIIKIGDILMTTINNKFLLPSPNEKAGDTARTIINNTKKKYAVF